MRFHVSTANGHPGRLEQARMRFDITRTSRTSQVSCSLSRLGGSQSTARGTSERRMRQVCIRTPYAKWSCGSPSRNAHGIMCGMVSLVSSGLSVLLAVWYHLEGSDPMQRGIWVEQVHPVLRYYLSCTQVDGTASHWTAPEGGRRAHPLICSEHHLEAGTQQ